MDFAYGNGAWCIMCSSALSIIGVKNCTQVNEGIRKERMNEFDK